MKKYLRMALSKSENNLSATKAQNIGTFITRKFFFKMFYGLKIFKNHPKILGPKIDHPTSNVCYENTMAQAIVKEKVSNFKMA